VILVFSGPPCSGKSEIANRLEASRGWLHLEMDAIRERLLPDSSHCRTDRKIAYRAMHLVAETMAARGHAVIVNAGYSHSEDRQAVAQAAARAGVPLVLIELTVTPETAIARSKRRRASHPGLDLSDNRVAELVKTFPLTRCGLVVDGELPIATMLSQVETYLQHPHPLSIPAWSEPS
jgi:predicted kinase